MGGPCVVCGGGAPAPRSCDLCDARAYCSAACGLNDWLARHKDECTYTRAGLGERARARRWLRTRGREEAGGAALRATRCCLQLTRAP